MPEIIDGLPTADTPTVALTLGPASNVAVINFNVLTQPANYRLWKPDPGSPGKSSKETLIRTALANTFGAYVNGATGVEFWSAVAGKPATVQAEMVFVNDARVFAGSISSLNFSSGGQIGGGLITGDLDAAGNIVGGTGFDVVYLGTGQYHIDFHPDKVFTAAPYLLYNLTNASAGSADVIACTGKSPSGFSVQTFDGGSNTHKNIAWNFVAGVIA